MMAMLTLWIVEKDRKGLVVLGYTCENNLDIKAKLVGPEQSILALIDLLQSTQAFPIILQQPVEVFHYGIAVNQELLHPFINLPTASECTKKRTEL